MTDQFLTGKWSGEYIYGDVYKEPIKGTRVPFEIDMVVTEGVVKGSCVDEEFKSHFKTPATIEGFVKENTITFIKRYPCLFSMDENGGIVLFPKLPSHEIHYSGQFADGQFTGDWEFKVPFAEENDGIEIHARTGHWQMQKL